MNFLPAKSEGRTVMTSDFVTVLDGILRFDDRSWEDEKYKDDMIGQIEMLGEERCRRAGSVLDVSRDGYYTSEKCIPDFLKAAEIVKTNHNGKYKPVFLIDHSPIHRYNKFLLSKTLLLQF